MTLEDKKIIFFEKLVKGAKPKPYYLLNFLFNEIIEMNEFMPKNQILEKINAVFDTKISLDTFYKFFNTNIKNKKHKKQNLQKEKKEITHTKKKEDVEKDDGAELSGKEKFRSFMNNFE